MSTKTRAHHHASHSTHTNQTSLIETLAEMPAVAEQKVSKQERFRLIQVCAYELWEHAGKPHSDQSRERFWCEAEEALGASQASIG